MTLARTDDEDSILLGPADRRAVLTRASPEGIVTILFTDIVQSTRLRQRLGDSAAQDLFREHNRLVRLQIEKNNGLEVKTYGDGFMVAFADVVDALSCALDIEKAIETHNDESPDQELSVRVGINAGRALREEDDFFGNAVIVAARIMDLAPRGGVVVSEVVRSLAGVRPGIRYIHRGRHRLKGLDQRYDVWSVRWREGAADDRWAANRRRFLVAILGSIAAVIIGVILAVALVRQGGMENAAQPQATASTDWPVFYEDDFADAEKTSFPKGTGSTLAGLIFSRGPEGGEYVVRLLKASAGTGLSSTIQPVFADSFAFEVDAKSSAPMQYGLVLSWGPADAFQIRLDTAKRSYELFYVQEGKLTERSSPALIRPGGAVNHVRAEIRGQEVVVLINGEVAETIKLESMQRRPVSPGLFVFVPSDQEVAEGSGIKVSFDDFKLFVPK